MSRTRNLSDLLDSNGDVVSGALDNVPPGFEAGTLMLFQQTTAPTGWTKQTAHNDKALRVVSGAVSSGGTTAFSTAMATPSVSGTVGLSGEPGVGNLAVSVSGNIGSATLSVNQIPSHSHNYIKSGTGGGGPAVNNSFGASVTTATSNTGGGGSHNHGHSLSGTLNGAPSAGNLAGSLSSATAAINVQYVDLIIASKD